MAMRLQKEPLSLLALLVLICSCSGNYSYQEHRDDFPDKKWKEDKVLTFEPSIEDTTGSFKVLFDLRHVYGFADAELRLSTKIISPSGKTQEKEHSFRILKKKKEGEDPKYVSNCSGDYCDRTVTLFENKRFSEKGGHTIEIRQMNRKVLPNVMEVGLMLKHNMSGTDVATQEKALQK